MTADPGKNAQRSVVVQCGYCYVTVLADVQGRVDCTNDEDWDSWYQAVLVRCPSCKEAVFATRPMEPSDSGPDLDWGNARRAWPHPEEYLDWAIPQRVRKSLEQARKCVNAGTYLAAAVMVRRALEAIANHFDAPDRALPARIEMLKDKGVIDARMFEWAQALRRHGNLGAHDSEGDVSEQDARDLLEFAETMCEYIFVLTKKFNDFQARQTAADPRPAELGEES